FILVLIVLVYYLDYKTAFWTAFGIPVALLGMIVFLRVFDISINLISLAGFIILLGMLVDNAIVIAEKYKTNREAGFSAKDAAIQAVDRMWAPVFASATTTMIAFAPLFMVSGFPGAFIWTIPLMVIVGLSVSLLENWFVLPLQLTYGQAKAQTIKPMKLEVYYRSTLKFFLRYRYSSLLVFVLILVLSLVSLRFLVRKDPFPQEAADSFSIAITLPVGMTAKLAEIEIGKIESLITLEVGDDLVGLSSRIGTQIEDSTTNRGIQSNLSILFVYLNSYEDRDRTANTIMQQLDTSLQLMATQNKMQYALNLQRIGPPMGKAIEVRILSDHDTDREEVASELLHFLQNTQGVSFVERDDRSGLKQTNLTLKQSLITSAGLRDHDILTSLRIALEGTIVTEMSNDDRKVRLKLNRMIHSVDELIKEIPVANRLGNLIHLDRFVSISESSTTATIAHVNSERSITISGNIDNQITSPTDIIDIVQQNFKVKDGVRLEFAGQGVETNLIFADLASASIIAVFGIYLVIALIFNSYTKPIIIMLALPFMAFGLAFTLVSHNLPGSMMVGVAGIGLMGVVVNTSIVMVDTIHALAGDMALTNELVIEG
ncbi:MAG: efflux RND transporter permease subunit, partial [Leptonema sp. (in: Bacteria)]|nr:efflux RND transporter permease subunit [Leptonema sp. (in: bacteria)]